MRTFAQKPKTTQQTASAKSTIPGRAHFGQSRAVSSILQLQRTIGNQAVQRMLQTNAEELEVGLTSTASHSHRFGHDFSRIPMHPPVAGTMQTKLAISKPGDEYEQEADSISEQVMRMPEPRLQRACACGGGCPKCQTEQSRHGHERLHTKRVESGDWEQTEVPPIIHEVLRSPGQPIDLATRAFMEPRFGYDFSHVRVHTDERAGDSAHAVNALAYTAGRHLVFGVGQYSPTTASGRRLLAHELAHSAQQGFAASPVSQLVGDSSSALQREEATAPTIDLPSSVDFPVHDKHIGFEGDDLRNSIQALVDKNVKTYVTYRDTISKSFPWEKRFALNQELLLTALKNTLDYLSFAKCVELLGRKAPTFDELRNNSMVYEAIKDAWKASNVVGDLVVQPHEEGGWVFLNLIDGSLSIERAKPIGGNFIILNPAPDVTNSVVVAVFHTHPFLGGSKAKPSSRDKSLDERDGVPDLVAANTRTNPDVFQIYLSGPAVRKHLASEYKFPGISGGIAP